MIRFSLMKITKNVFTIKSVDIWAQPIVFAPLTSKKSSEDQEKGSRQLLPSLPACTAIAIVSQFFHSNTQRLEIIFYRSTTFLKSCSSEQ